MQVQTSLTETIRELIEQSDYDKAAETFLKETNTRLTVKYKTYGKHFPGDTDSRDIYRVTISRNISGKVRKMSFDFGQSLKDTGRNGLHYTGDIENLKPGFVQVFNAAGFGNVSGYVQATTKAERENIIEQLQTGLMPLYEGLQVEGVKNLFNKNADIRTYYPKKHFVQLPEAEQSKLLTRWTAEAKNMALQNTARTLRKITHVQSPAVAPGAYSILSCLTKYDPDTFEDFCGNYGYDTDSRQAEKTYKAVCKEYESLTRLYDSEELEAMAEIQ